MSTRHPDGFCQTGQKSAFRRMRNWRPKLCPGYICRENALCQTKLDLGQCNLNSRMQKFIRGCGMIRASYKQ